MYVRLKKIETFRNKTVNYIFNYQHVIKTHQPRIERFTI